jgi:hypothetical protein
MRTAIATLSALLLAVLPPLAGAPARALAADPPAPPAIPAPGLPPPVPAAVQELHGTFAGQRFWVRLKAPDPQFKGNRVLELVYTPPPADQLAGAVLSDVPFLLVDDHLRIVAWNGRDTGSTVTPGAPTGYKIGRDLEQGEGVDRHVENEKRAILGERGWDLRLAPVLLALGWSKDSAGALRAVDLFGPRHGEALTVAWTGTAVTVAGQAWTIVPDADGRMQEVKDADGKVVLTVAGRL